MDLISHQKFFQKSNTIGTTKLQKIYLGIVFKKANGEHLAAENGAKKNTSCKKRWKRK